MFENRLFLQMLPIFCILETHCAPYYTLLESTFCHDSKNVSHVHIFKQATLKIHFSCSANISAHVSHKHQQNWHVFLYRFLRITSSTWQDWQIALKCKQGLLNPPFSRDMKIGALCFNRQHETCFIWVYPPLILLSSFTIFSFCQVNRKRWRN